MVAGCLAVLRTKDGGSDIPASSDFTGCGIAGGPRHHHVPPHPPATMQKAPATARAFISSLGSLRVAGLLAGLGLGPVGLLLRSLLRLGGLPGLLRCRR